MNRALWLRLQQQQQEEEELLVVEVEQVEPFLRQKQQCWAAARDMENIKDIEGFTKSRRGAMGSLQETSDTWNESTHKAGARSKGLPYADLVWKTLFPTRHHVDQCRVADDAFLHGFGTSAIYFIPKLRLGTNDYGIVNIVGISEPTYTSNEIGLVGSTWKVPTSK